jgi:hypothetical protein
MNDDPRDRTLDEDVMSNHPIIKNVSSDWTWMSDYVFAWAQWTVNCPTDRECQVGKGIKMFGEPRGEKIHFSGYCEFTTIGVGAIHVRTTDGKGPTSVRLDQGKVGLVPIIDGQF